MRRRVTLRLMGVFFTTSVGVILVAFFILGGASALWALTLKIPDVGNFETREVVESTKIYDRTGKVVLYDVHGTIKRSVVSLEDVSPFARQATIAIEDANFYTHHGFDARGIARAFIVNLGSGEVRQGGSTITQQVIKNALLTRDKSITRKLKELILAVKIEKVLPKDAILEVYLNEAPYGGTLYGIEEAAQAFFAKNAKDLSLTEAAYLAALPQAPTYYSPYGTHRDALEKRKNLVLRRMRELGFISAADEKKAREEQVEFKQRDDGGIKAPHFVDFVRSYLEEKYGRDRIEREGFTVITTLDWDLQKKSEQLVAQYAQENETQFRARNAGMVAINPKTGEILAMVGSRNYFDQTNEGNFNITLAKRQPGSAFKPFVYATAFAKGYTPETIVFDVKTEFSTVCSPEGTPLREGADATVCYHPENYDTIFRGPVTLRNALAQSINIPAVKVSYLVGIRNAIATARAAGISTLTDPDRYGLSLALGGGEVTLLEMVSAYGVFANDGVRNPYAFIVEIKDREGTSIEKFSQQEERVMSEGVARLISDVLSDNVARAPAFGGSSYLFFPNNQVAVKTGTTNDYRDAWVIGYTPSIVIGAWAGNNDNSSMEKRVAGFIIAPLWHAIMDEALNTLPSESFLPPPPNTARKPILRGVWNQGGIHSILHWVDRDDPDGLVPLNPSLDPQYHLWESAVQKWAQGVNTQTIPSALVSFPPLGSASTTP